jgi:hypothetical protein
MLYKKSPSGWCVQIGFLYFEANLGDFLITTDLKNFWEALWDIVTKTLSLVALNAMSLHIDIKTISPQSPTWRFEGDKIGEIT